MQATPFIAALALGLSALSLFWQAWSWWHSGAVIKVKVSNSIPVYGDRPGEWFITVTAVNRGRLPTSVEAWGLRTPGQQDMVILENENWASPLPLRLEPSSSGQWHIRADEVREACSRNGWRCRDLRAWVRLGSDKRIYAPRGLPIKGSS